LIAELATAAREQSSGISQISTALSQIDQAIQGNAAHTSNISDSASAMQEQAETLNELTVRLNQFSGVKEIKKENQQEDVHNISSLKNQNKRAS
jgi:hypothetical protein